MNLVVATFLALLALTALAGLVLIIVLAVMGRLEPVRSALGLGALWLAFAVALTATAGSLYFSEVAGLEPCTLCWYQRIAMYPLAADPGRRRMAGRLGRATLCRSAGRDRCRRRHIPCRAAAAARACLAPAAR